MTIKEEWLAGTRSAVPIMLGYVPVGIAYGVMARQAGLNTWQTVLMSLTVYGGASEMMAAGMVAQGAAVLPIVLTTFILNLRHIIMSTCVFSQMQGGCPGIDGNDPARGHAQIGRHISLKLLHFLADAQVAVFADDAMHGLGFGLANDGTGKSHAHVSLRGFPPCPAVRRAHRSAPRGGRQKKGQENPALTCYQ